MKDEEKGLLHKVGDKIKESVPDGMKSDEEQIADFIPEQSQEKSGPEQIPDPKTVSYVDQMIAKIEKVVLSAESELMKINESIQGAKHQVELLKIIKNNDFKFDLDWLINKIGELKNRHDLVGFQPLALLEDEIFSILEKEIDDHGKLKK